jgi:hypothetical protein
LLRKKPGFAGVPPLARPMATCGGPAPSIPCAVAVSARRPRLIPKHPQRVSIIPMLDTLPPSLNWYLLGRSTIYSEYGGSRCYREKRRKRKERGIFIRNKGSKREKKC